MRVLLVEDDALLGAGLERGLEALGMNVAWAREAASAFRLLQSEPGQARSRHAGVEQALHIRRSLSVPDEDETHATPWVRIGGPSKLPAAPGLRLVM